MSKKAAPRTRRSSTARTTVRRVKTTQATPPARSFLFREVELGLMGLVTVILVVLFIGVAGTMALSYGLPL